MPIRIPYGMSYQVTVTGRAPKLVTCEKCGHEYVYLLEASAAGHASSNVLFDPGGAHERAHEAAYGDLHHTLEYDCEAVPCASCGHVQEHMRPKARRRHRRWLKTLALLAFAFGGILTAPAMIVSMYGRPSTVGNLLWVAVGCLFACSAAMAFFRLYLLRDFDPNAQPVELRKQLGQALAVSKDEYVKMMQEDEERARAEAPDWKCFKCGASVAHSRVACPLCGFRLTG
jgi:hypothetical protein